MVFKPLSGPALRSAEVHERVGDSGVGETIHGSDSEMRAPPRAKICIIQVSLEPSTGLAEVPLLGRFLASDLVTRTVTLPFPPFLLEVTSGNSIPAHCQVSCDFLDFCPPTPLPSPATEGLIRLWSQLLLELSRGQLAVTPAFSLSGQYASPGSTLGPHLRPGVQGGV